MTSYRLYAAGPLAGCATAALFLGMQFLAGPDGEVDLDPVSKSIWVDPIQVDEEETVRERDRELERPEEVEAVDLPEVIELPHDVPTGDGISIGPVAPESGSELPTIDLGVASDGDYLPLVRVQPQYPRIAQDRGIEGYAVVELTVAADGSVPAESVRIVEAQPAGTFDKTAIKAARKFKYKPKVVNGIAQAVTGVRYRFTFSLAD